MGFNTAIVVLNDGLDEIERDPEAGRKIVQGVLRSHREDYIGIGNHVNCISVLPSQHADIDQLVLVGGNSIKLVTNFFGALNSDEPLAEQVFAALAHQLGYSFTKRPWRKRLDETA